jgi:hypothetical protein
MGSWIAITVGVIVAVTLPLALALYARSRNPRV